MRRLVPALALLFAATPLAAQLREVTQEEATIGPIRGIAGFHADYMRPEGEFGQFVQEGLGLSGFVGASFGRNDQVSVGLEGGFVGYGRRTKTVPLSPTIPELYVDVTTSNNIATIGIPLRIELTPGPVRPYVYGSVGLAYFWTQTSAKGTASDGDFATSVNFDDLTANWSGGAGLSIQVSHGRTPVAIDISMRHVANGLVQYLNEDSIQSSGGTTVITPIESEANFTAYQVGVSFGLR